MHANTINVLASILIAGIILQWVGWRLRIPGLILLIIAGLVMGPVSGWLNPDEVFGSLLQPMISLSVAVILFEGGLNLRWQEFKQNRQVIHRLVSWAVLISFTLSSLAAHYMVGMDWAVALIFGAIVIVTGPTVIMPLLKQARLKRRPAALLRWEGIVNDPVGAVLAVLIFSYYQQAAGGSLFGGIVLGLLQSLVTAIVLGVGTGVGLGYMFRRGMVPEYLKPPLILAAVLLVFVLANQVLSEAGLMAVTVLGITLANLPLGSLQEVKRFKEYVTLLLVSATFIILTANIKPQIIMQLGWHSWLMIALIVFAIRPLSIFLATVRSDISGQERALVAWIAPRGIVAAAVAGFFGVQLTQLGYKGAELLLPLVFTLIIVTVILHGLSIGWLARRWELASSHPEGVLLVGSTPWSASLAEKLQKHNVLVLMNDSSWAHLRPARMKNLATQYGEILSEHTEELVELSYITRLLALTDNEAYNTLVCSYFAPELGYNHVYQIAWREPGSDGEKLPNYTLRGYNLFGDKLLFSDFERTYREGWDFFSTRLSDKFTLEQLQEQKPQASHLIAVISPQGYVEFYPWPRDTKPGKNWVIITYAPPQENDADKAKLASA
ncbi:MAG: sodium:proton exchanger [Proteobacteria bacterium]|nr:MAG: sodium:proton exchanger [Pseudomonadota bacterium]